MVAIQNRRSGEPLGWTTQTQWISTAIADSGVSFGSVQTIQPAMTNVLYGDCTSGVCCAGLECTSDVSGDNFSCQAKLQ